MLDLVPSHFVNLTFRQLAVSSKDIFNTWPYRRHDIQHNDIRHCDIQHNGSDFKLSVTFKPCMLLSVIMMNVVMLSVVALPYLPRP